MLFFLKKWLWGKVRQMLWGKVRHCGERSNPGKTVPIYQIAGLVNEAFLSAVTPRNITSGFRSTGIFPYNRDIFPEEAFAPSMVSDRPNPELQAASTGPSTSDDPSGPSTSDDLDGPRPADDPPPADDPEGPIPANEPPADEPPAADDPFADTGPSTARGLRGCASPADSDVPCVPSRPGYVSPREIPLPKYPPRAQTKRNCVKTAILTDTPEKQTIEKAYVS